MKSDLYKIAESCQDELVRVEEHLKGMFRCDSAFIQTVGRHILGSGGKRIRPLFLLASARLMGYKGNDHIALASVIEIIHTASLLHDDVVDSAELRRGKPVANAIWGNPVVILVGDYLYSTALKHAVLADDLRVIESLSSAISGMAEGELLQLEKSADVNISEAEYVRIITAKTGGLISSACRIGAILGGATPVEEKALTDYGLKVGLAFQMADDILDYVANESDFGKRLGTDLDEGKITLPMILLLRAVNDEERKLISLMIKRGRTDEGMERIMELFTRYGIIEGSLAKAKSLVQDANDALMIFPPSAGRDGMMGLAEYALIRNK